MKKPLIRKRITLPGWLFAGIMALLCEVVLHLWTVETIHWGRFAAVAVYGLGFGALIGLICSFFRGRAEKPAAAIVVLVLIVLYMTEYFMIDTYKNYMSLSTMLSRAGDVMGDFGHNVIYLLTHSLGRIGLVLLPLVLYLLLARGNAAGWKIRGLLAGLALAGYLLGTGVVHLVGMDADRFSRMYDFDSAIRSFGLNVGLTLDALRNSDVMEEPGFIQELPSQTEATHPADTEPVSDQATVPTEPPVVYEPHTLGLDFALLAETETNATIRSIHSYVASLEPAMENEYTGLFAGKNLIFITAEAFSAEVIHPERTPTLYRLANEGIRFTDYYQPAWGASTTTGEFSNLTGIVPVDGGNSMLELADQDMFLLVGKQLQKLGYHTQGYHNHSFTYYNRATTHGAPMGLDGFMGMGNGMEEGVQYVSPESDLEMMEFTIPRHLDDEPFYLYYMTMSGHGGYLWEHQAMARKNAHLVEDLEASSGVKCYLAASMELEFAMESLVRQLEEAGIAENIVIVLASDHYPYTLEKSAAWGSGQNGLEELYGMPVRDCFTRDHNALIIWSPCLEDMDIVVEEPVFSLDLLPTLSNLFGLEYDSRLVVGRDVFSDDIPLVFWNTYSWKTDKGSYNSLTKTFTPAEGVEVPEGYADEIYALVANRITFSRMVQKNDYYDILQKLLQEKSD